MCIPGDDDTLHPVGSHETCGIGARINRSTVRVTGFVLCHRLFRGVDGLPDCDVCSVFVPESNPRCVARSPRDLVDRAWIEECARDERNSLNDSREYQPLRPPRRRATQDKRSVVYELAPTEEPAAVASCLQKSGACGERWIEASVEDNVDLRAAVGTVEVAGVDHSAPKEELDADGRVLHRAEIGDAHQRLRLLARSASDVRVAWAANRRP